MPGISYLSEIQMITLALVIIRVSAFFVVFPLVENAQIPNSVKILLSFMVGFVLYAVVPNKGLTTGFIAENLIYLVIKEAFIGILVGFIAKFFFQTVSIAGDIMTMSMGLSSDQMFNPAMGRRVTAVENYQLLLAGLLFLSLNGHHMFIEGLAKSFDLVPLTQIGFNFAVLRDVSLVAQTIMEMGVKIAAPIMGAIFIANLALGIIGRTVPQINVLVTSWPINILLGFGVLIISLPLLIVSLGELMNWNAEVLMDVLTKM